MIVRCERCRSVYDDAPEKDGPRAVVTCGRCSHVFLVTTALSRVTVVGTLGGAAAEILPESLVTPPAPMQVFGRVPQKGHDSPKKQKAPPEPKEPAREPSADDEFTPAPKSRLPVVVATLGVLLIIAAVAFFTLSKRRKPAHADAALPAAAAQKISEGEAALLKDDLASLEKAVAAFDQAGQLAPDHLEVKGLKASALVLTASALKAEALELGLQASNLDRQRRAIEPGGDREEARGKLAERMNDAKARVPAAQERSDRLLREGIELAKDLATNGQDDAPEVQRALALAYATMLNGDKLDALLKRVASESSEDDPPDAWLEYARGSLRALGRLSPQKAQEAREGLEKALKIQPGMLRAKWDLARVALTMNPPELEKAEKLIFEIANANAAHEGAQRLLALVDLVRGVPPVPAGP